MNMQETISAVLKNSTTLIYLAGLTAIFFILFGENYVLSDDYSLLPLREIDDSAFQMSLRRIHEDLQEGKLRRLFMTNDYGYGAIFWFSHGVITFVPYLLSSDHYVILLPRLLSLFFAFASLFFIYKIARLYTDKIYLCVAAALIYALQPEFAFMSLRFHTHAQLLFFSILGMYLLLRSSDFASLFKWSIVSFACAIATKMNAIILLPGVALYLYLISQLSILDFIKKYWKPALAGILLALFLFNPAIVLFFIFPKKALKAIETLIKFMHFAGINYGSVLNELPWHKIKNGLFIRYSGVFTLILPVVVALTGLVKYRTERAKGAFLLAFSLTFLLCIIIFSITVKQGPGAYANYLIPLSAIFCFSVLAFDLISPRWDVLWVAVLLSALFFFNAERNDERWHYYTDKLEEEANVLKMQDYQLIAERFGTDDQPIIVLNDYTILVPFSSLSEHVKRHAFYNNFANFTADYDIVIIGKNNPITWPEEQIKENYVNYQPYLDGAEAYKELVSTQTLNGHHYDIALENERFVLYEKSDLPAQQTDKLLD